MTSPPLPPMMLSPFRRLSEPLSGGAGQEGPEVVQDKGYDVKQRSEHQQLQEQLPGHGVGEASTSRASATSHDTSRTGYSPSGTAIGAL